jgi:hypothetical protein
MVMPFGNFYDERVVCTRRYALFITKFPLPFTNRCGTFLNILSSISIFLVYKLQRIETEKSVIRLFDTAINKSIKLSRDFS